MWGRVVPRKSTMRVLFVGVVHTVPVAITLIGALTLFGAWAAVMIRAQRSQGPNLLGGAPRAALRAHLRDDREQIAGVQDFPCARAAIAEVLGPSSTDHSLFAETEVEARGAKPLRPAVVEAAADETNSATVRPRRVVRPGSFCTVPGHAATTAVGTPMICIAVGGTRPRWRRAHSDRKPVSTLLP
jgi:hypothetical protein